MRQATKHAKALARRSSRASAKSIPPKPNLLMTDIDAAFAQKAFHVPILVCLNNGHWKFFL